jgi:hypothetical protein
MTSSQLTRLRSGAVAALVVVLATGVAGCEVGTQDDELDAPRRTVTATASPSPSPVASVPAAEGPVAADDVVWSQGSRLHVGRRTVDVAPLTVDAFVVVSGAVYLLSSGELWFTDLSRVRPTGLTGLSGLDLSADGSLLRATTSTGTALVFRTTDGKRVAAPGYRPAPATDRLGTRVRLSVPGVGTLTARRGPGRFAAGLDPSGATVVVDTVTGDRVPLRGATPLGLVLGGWVGASTFYGAAGPAGTGSVVSCDAVRRTCTDLGRTTGTDPVLFGAGR